MDKFHRQNIGIKKSTKEYVCISVYEVKYSKLSGGEMGQNSGNTVMRLSATREINV